MLFCLPAATNGLSILDLAQATTAFERTASNIGSARGQDEEFIAVVRMHGSLPIRAGSDAQPLCAVRVRTHN
jgi:hypothetical protein